MSPEDHFHALVADIDHPMFIVTAAANGRHGGCLVGFVTQASIDPPRLIVMLSKANDTWRVAQGASELVVHFLRHENYNLARLFGEETSDAGVDKFASCSWEESTKRTPIIRGTRGWIIGEILERVDAGDHVAHLLNVKEAQCELAGALLMFQEVRDLDPGHPA